MPNGENTPKNTALRPAWGPGQSGNPAGRPKGARNKLGEAFLEALHADFNEHGAEAIVKTRETKPEVYVRVIAGLLPSEMTLNINPAEELTDEQLADRIRTLAAQLAPFLVDGTGAATGDNEGAAGQSLPARVH